MPDLERALVGLTIIASALCESEKMVVGPLSSMPMDEASWRKNITS